MTPALLAAAWLAAGGAVAAPPGSIRLAADFDEHNFADAAKIELPAAVRAAQKKAAGPVIWAGYENLDGFLFAYVQVAGKRKSVTTVTVDAGNGRVVDVSSKTAAQLAEEAKAEEKADAEKAKDPDSEEARKAKEAAAEAKSTGPRYKSSIKVSPEATGAQLAAAAKIGVQQAMTEASRGHPGKFTSAGVIQDHGWLLYAVTVKSADGAFTLYMIDAGTGKLLGNEAGG